MGADAGDVCDPELIRGIDIELSVQGVVGYDSRAATIRAGLLFVTNLGPYACQTRKAPNPVWADVLTRIAKIVVQLAIAIDLAAVIPGRFHQLGLALILQRPLGKWFAQPCIEAARMNQQHPAHRPYRKHQPVLSYERIPHPLPDSGCLHPR